MGNIISIAVERWSRIFDESNLSVCVSSHGNVKFVIDASGVVGVHILNAATLSKEQMLRLGQSLTSAFMGDDNG